MVFKWTHYEIKLICQNCGFDNKLAVRKGVLIGEFIKSSSCKCKQCGCKIESKEKDGKKEKN